MNTDATMAALDTWAREDAHIYPDVSTCRFYSACNAGGILNGKHCMMSYVGRDYGAPGTLRLALVGMDHRDQKSGSFGERRTGIEGVYQTKDNNKLNPHYQGVVKTAAAVFDSSDCTICAENWMCRKSRAPSISCVIDSIAQPNFVKCVRSDVQSSKCLATSPMKTNCAQHLLHELKLLQPDLIIFHFADAPKIILPAIEAREIPTVSMLYEWMDAHILFVKHPSYGWLDSQWDSVVVPALDYLRHEGRILTRG
jgi:hypothetical protein